MSNKLTKALNKIGKLVNEMNTFNLTPRDPPPTIDRETQSFIMESKVIGREREKEQIVSELLNPPRERDNISVFAIVGIGGAGKTTLAQYVFNDERVKEHFQLSLWVCVSIDEFNVIEIIKSIIERASGDASKNSKEMLQHELRKILDKKRYLLVLDDVWSKEREKWNELRMLLCSAAGAGSVIIVTTRDQGVASTMETFPNHNLEKLTDEDSYELFKNRAFGAWVEKPTEEHYEIGKTIAHKCGGLPLVQLPSEMRYLINLRHLFLDGCPYLKHMPIGLGQLNYLQTLTKYVLNPSKGGSIRELNQLNLLSGHISLCGLESIRDRDDAQSVNLAKKTNLCSLELRWNDTLNGGAGSSKPILEALMPHDKLKYLHISGYRGFGFPKWIMEVQIISSLKGLKLNWCINCAELPPLWLLPLLEDLYIEKMGNLISFVGSMCKNVEGKKSLIIFPALKNLTIRILPNLESWHEEGSESVAFPELKTLAIDGCPKLKSIPTHVSLLTSLELNNCTEIKLRQISYLPMLSKLSISLNDMPFREPDAFRPPKNIEELKIVGYENVYPLEEEGELLISCQTRPVLRKLTILKSYCFLSCGPSKVVALEFWKYFAAVEYLVIDQCDNLVFWPEEELRSLKCLKNLFVFGCRNLTGALTEQQQASSLDYYLTPPLPLPHLEQFVFERCPELVQVPFVCSKPLKDLSINYCPKLNIGEMLTHVITDPTELKHLSITPSTHWSVWPDNMKHLPSLDSLQIGWYLGIELVPPGLHLPSLTKLNISRSPGESFPPCLHLPSLVDFVIYECPGIKSFPPGLRNRLPSLQRLFIDDCPALERRCRSGGDYYDLVSSIPDLVIGTYRHNWKSLLKNLPCIRSS
ncbi:NBS-LRR-like resistance protein [Rhynchospora pubera]|uniref:NBS-LRR-like resistance protein n=1 Tax=Rhynchospora pubera TaxID=906938 RepID=A0AAV8FC86_9POAL|nr:NBS-LRR-like resistance protein [Rhynchospora pubera]